MPQISFSGNFTLGTLVVPDVYLNILPPAPGGISPATFGILGYVGVASWGPVGSAVLIGSTDQLSAGFGFPTVRANDLVTAASIALVEQSAAGTGANLMLSRVTDGTDVAATSLIQSSGPTSYGMLLTAFWTGTLGNQITARLSAGSKTGSWALTLTLPPFTPETFDNITGTGAVFWNNLIAAVNTGSGVLRGPSRLVVASAGTGANATVAPATGTYTFTGGLDGTASVTTSNLVGQDVSPRTGIYVFRGAGLTDLCVVDLYDPTAEPTLGAFGVSEGVYCHVSGPPGETPLQGQTAKATAGTDTPWIKRWLGDWGYWLDTYNGTLRVLPASTFGSALMSGVPPMLSAVNRRSNTVQSTQRSRANNIYGPDELRVITGSGMDVICNPIPAGSMFGARTGRNASSNPTINGDNWPRLTSFLARSLAGPGALGTLIGQTITDEFFRIGYDMLDVFLAPFKDPNNGPQMIEDYAIVFSRANNPESQTGRGIVVCQVSVRFLGIALVFLVNLQTGQTVVIEKGNNVSAVSAALAAQ